MKFAPLLLLSFAVFVGCVQAPRTSYSENDWLLKPATADQSLNIDDQFLKKSHDKEIETASSRRLKKSFLNP